ncbi:hypothetical protein EIP91_002900 [Steccherinum ochraceum]|uniref:SnoaL-like domain-containing protein n=1 Tax=Steccherinum ochraceum TaxID=92696 RepID=A0A4R0S2F1_9APHY|nr:hypothetical protein EIP91_002900 [Steccherinum ochraceum]
MPILSTDAVKGPSAQLRAVLRWLDAVTTSHDADALAAVLTDDYTHIFLPKSLGLPSYDKPSFIEYAQNVLMPLLTEYNTTIHEVIQTEDKVVVHSTSIGRASTGHTYTSEIMVIAHVVPDLDGEYKIKAFSEFADSNLVADFYFAQVKRQEEAELVKDV